MLVYNDNHRKEMFRSIMVKARPSYRFGQGFYTEIGLISACSPDIIIKCSRRKLNITKNVVTLSVPVSHFSVITPK